MSVCMLHDFLQKSLTNWFWSYKVTIIFPLFVLTEDFKFGFAKKWNEIFKTHFNTQYAEM